VLQTYSNIVPIFTLGGIAPPAILQSNADRIAFNDNFILDTNKWDKTALPTVRRSDLFVNSPQDGNFDAFPFRLALIYLQGKDIVPKADPEEPEAMLLGKARLRPLHPNDGAYVRTITDEFQLLLDFKCPENFTRFSVVDILSGKAPAGTMRDK